jgi:hypothetical protein
MLQRSLLRTGVTRGKRPTTAPIAAFSIALMSRMR